MSKELTKKEEAFCRYYCALRNPRQAAYLAGYKVLSTLNAEKLLARQEVRDFITRLDSNADAVSCAKAGLRRIAFGSVADAIKLLDGGTADAEALDLFMVSDIKMPKGGGMEIKFFDRLKALEELAALESDSQSGGSLEFYRALENSAKILSERRDDSES